MVLSSKKAQVELSLEQIIGLVIAIVIVLATLLFFTGLMNIFMGPPDSGSEATFQFIFDAVELMYDSKNMNDTCIIQPSYLEGDWSIVGFNADDIIAADDNDITCELGKDCIEEKCGLVNQNIIKPTSCGKGPCICLCDGGGATGVGDVDGDDCQESNAKCRKLASNVGFDTFHFVSDKCHKGSYGSKTGLCDLVYSGESCSGGNYKTQMTLVIKKGKGYKSGNNALIFDLVSTSDVQKYYPKAPGCRQMVEDMKRVIRQAQAPAAAAAAEKKDCSLRDAMAKTGADVSTGYEHCNQITSK